MSVFISNLTDSWNDASIKFDGIKLSITDVNSSANSTLFTVIVNNTERFVVNKSGEIVEGSINANSVIGFNQTVNDLTTTIEEARDLAALYGSARVYENWSTLSAVTGSANTAAIITSDTGTHTDPVITPTTTVPNAGLYIWSSTPAGWKWIDNTVAFNAYESALAANTSAVVSASAAVAASAALNLVQTLVLSQKLYYSTFAQAISATNIGDIFTCDEGGSWAYYKRTSTSPFYQLFKFVITEDYLNSSIVGGANVYEDWLSLGTRPAANGTIGVVLTNDQGTHTDPVMANTVPNSGVFVRYPAGWKRIANTEALDARTSAISANTSKNLATAAATTAVAAANTASFAYDALKNVALAEGLYYPTIAAGIANTTNGFIFTSDEGGVWNYYKKTATSPFYEYYAEVANPTGPSVVGVYEFTAANNQNTFTVDTDISNVQVSVFANGVRLQSNNFTKSGNTVILGTNRVANDTVAIVTTRASIYSISSASVVYNSNTSYSTGSVGRELAKLPLVSRNFANDSVAASAGIPIGDMYHDNGIVRLRIT